MIHIHDDRIPFNVVVQYAAQITQAMSYLHEKRINHMSLRSSNIFVQNSRIILTDYGLAPLSKCYRFQGQSAIVAPRGWLSYLAPELLRKLDPRNELSILQHTTQTDVYAFGTVWYELIYREFPFAKQPPEYIIWRAGNSLKQPLSSVHISKYAKVRQRNAGR
jgi:serine/threonine protein kinase